MAVYKCKMCGGDLNIEADINVIECEYCGTTQTVPTANSEKKVNLFNRANRLRLNSEFDKAAGIYENIIAEFPEEAEAYWGLCLCNYGIEYVDDPATAKKIPTCHRASFEKLADDENYSLAMEYADIVAQKVYRDEAREIDRIMDNILSISKNEKPYDVFICYKETDEKGERTIDSVLAQDIYDALTAKGMKVFFARISLEDKLGQMYEPYIFAALNSANVMLCVGTKYEYFHAVWVKNEWSRFLKLIAKDKSKLLIPCYKDIDAYDMPEEFKALQAQDMGKIGFVQDLVRGVEKVTGINSLSVGKTGSAPETSQNSLVAPLIERAFIFIEDSKWESADEYCEKALDLEPRNAQAYLGKLLSEYKKHNIAELEIIGSEVLNNDNYLKFKRYADESLLSEFNLLVERLNQNLIIKEKISLLNKMIAEKQEEVKQLNSLTVSIDSFTTPFDNKILESQNELNRLRAEYETLGVFKLKEKQAISYKILEVKKTISNLEGEVTALKDKKMSEMLQERRKKALESIKEKFDCEITLLCEELYQMALDLLNKEHFINANEILDNITDYKNNREKLLSTSYAKEYDQVHFVQSPMPGNVKKILVKPQQHVEKGDILLTLDVMLMEEEVRAKVSGTVEEIFVKPGEVIQTNDKLMLIV